MNTTNDDTKIALIKRFVQVSLAISLALVMIILMIKTGWGFVLALFALVYFGSHLVLGAKTGHNYAPNIVFALAVLNFCFVIPELFLTIFDFRYESGLHFEMPNSGLSDYYVPDADLFWKLSPKRQNVNSFGFHGDEVKIPKPGNVFRILFLGDSCTECARFPEDTANMLNHKPSSTQKSTMVSKRSILKTRGPQADRQRYESVVLALTGYSSHQGKVTARLYADKVDPDLAVIYYGWNDHWLAYGAIDSAQVVRDNRLRLFSYGFYQKVRLLQAFRKGYHFIISADKPLDQVRVQEQEYRQNLVDMALLFQKKGVPVLFVTAPTAHYQLGVPDYLIEKNFVKDKQTAVALHQQYNQIVREVAENTSSVLVDLEKEFNSKENIADIFMEDGIHFTPVGSQAVATSLANTIRKVPGPTKNRSGRKSG
ncbi:hypothetical protein JXQ70_20660 [bacterium]|nr:hypothetical protein [bacterium]